MGDKNLVLTAKEKCQDSQSIMVFTFSDSVKIEKWKVMSDMCSCMMYSLDLREKYFNLS